MKLKEVNIKKRHIWWLLLVITIIFPFAMDHLIIGNNIFSNISNSDWVSFFASYIGAITSAVGIIMTIEHAKKEAREDRRLSLAPLTRYEVERKDKFDEIILNDSIKLCEPYRLKLDKEDVEWTERLLIKIENIGMGPLLNLKITDVKFGGKDFENVQISEAKKILKKDNVLYITTMLVRKQYNSYEELDKKEKKPEDIHVNLSFVVRYDDAINTHYEEEITSIFSIFFKDQPNNSIWVRDYSFSISNIEKANRK